MREASLDNPLELHHSQGVWVDEAFHNQLWYGVPTLGWPGDFRLVLGQSQSRGDYALLRLVDDPVSGVREYRVVKRLGQRPVLDERLIRWLVEHDARNGYDAVAEVDKADAVRERVLRSERLAAFEELADRHHFKVNGRRLHVVGDLGKGDGK